MTLTCQKLAHATCKLYHWRCPHNSQTVIDSALTTPQVPTVAWEDIGGYEDVKQALREMIEVGIMYQSLHAVAAFESEPGIAEFSRCSFACGVQARLPSSSSSECLGVDTAAPAAGAAVAACAAGGIWRHPLVWRSAVRAAR